MFLATEEHRSRASPELERDWRGKLQPQNDLPGEMEGHGEGRRGRGGGGRGAGRGEEGETGRATETWHLRRGVGWGGGVCLRQKYSIYSLPSATHFRGSLKPSALPTPWPSLLRWTLSEKNMDLIISFLPRS